MAATAGGPAGLGAALAAQSVGSVASSAKDNFLGGLDDMAGHAGIGTGRVAASSPRISTPAQYGYPSRSSGGGGFDSTGRSPMAEIRTR